MPGSATTPILAVGSIDPVQDLRVDGRRLWSRLDELGRIGGLAGGGCCRLALTDDDRAGRDLVVAWMEDLGMTVEVDAVGNILATRAGRDAGAAPVMCGSHIDTVRTGGLYDGNLGVLAGLEVVETLSAAGITTARPLVVAVFCDEEGARFAPDMLGSLVYAGGMSVEEAHDAVGIDGARLGDELDRIGYLGTVPCPGRVPHAYVELHIEQGPVLEADGVDHRRRHRRPGHLVDGGRRRGPFRATPGRPRCTCATTPGSSPWPSAPASASSSRTTVRRSWAPSAVPGSSPTSSTSSPGGRRSRSTSATATKPPCSGPRRTSPRSSTRRRPPRAAR